MRFQMYAESDGGGSKTEARYYALGGNVSGQSTVNNQTSIVALEKCYLEGLHVIGPEPGAGKGLTFEFVINGVAKPETAFKIEGSAIEGIWNGKIEVKENETIAIKVTPNGEAELSAGNWYIVSTINTVGNTFFMSGGFHANSPSKEVTNYAFIRGIYEGAWATEAKAVAAPIPIPCNIKKFSVRSSLSPGSAKSFTYSILQNESTAILPIKLEGTSEKEKTESGTAKINTGDSLCIRSVPAGSPTQGQVTWTILVEPEELNIAFQLGMMSVAESSNTETRYAQKYLGFGGTWGTGSANKRYGVLGKYKDFYVIIGTAPGASKGRSYKFEVGETVRELVAKVEGASTTTAHDTEHSFEVTNYSEKIRFLSTPVSTPAENVGGVKWGVALIAPVHPPSVETKTPSEIHDTSLKLSSSINPEGGSTKYFFEYGTTEALGSATAETSMGEGKEAKEETATITGLKRSTKYYYRAVATNPGGTIQGAIKSVTTGCGIKIWNGTKLVDTSLEIWK